MNSQTGATPGSDIKQKRLSHFAGGDRFVERRAKPRMEGLFPARGRGLDASGREFDLALLVRNISSVGLFLRIPLGVELGDELNLLVQLPNEKQGITVSLQAAIVRIEPALDGWRGIAMAILRHEFL